jgi:hypothetical protein
MKKLFTILMITISMSVFGQADVKFDIFEQMKMNLDTSDYTKVVVFDTPDTCYINVHTNEIDAITVMGNTYGLIEYENKEGNYTFHFPMTSSGRIITNLSSVLGTDYKVHKVNVY